MIIINIYIEFATIYYLGIVVSLSLKCIKKEHNVHNNKFNTVNLKYMLIKYEKLSSLIRLSILPIKNPLDIYF